MDPSDISNASTRIHPCYPCRLRVTVQGEVPTRAWWTAEIGRGALFFRTPDPPETGERLALILEIPRDGAQAAVAIEALVSRVSGTEGGLPACVQIEILDMAPPDRGLWEGLVNSLEAFADDEPTLPGWNSDDSAGEGDAPRPALGGGWTNDPEAFHRMPTRVRKHDFLDAATKITLWPWTKPRVIGNPLDAQLDQAKAFVLSLIDGQTTVRDIIELSPLNPEDTTRLLTDLVRAEFLGS